MIILPSKCPHSPISSLVPKLKNKWVWIQSWRTSFVGRSHQSSVAVYGSMIPSHHFFPYILQLPSPTKMLHWGALHIHFSTRAFLHVNAGFAANDVLGLSLLDQCCFGARIFAVNFSPEHCLQMESLFWFLRRSTEKLHGPWVREEIVKEGINTWHRQMLAMSLWSWHGHCDPSIFSGTSSLLSIFTNPE